MFYAKVFSAVRRQVKVRPGSHGIKLQKTEENVPGKELSLRVVKNQKTLQRQEKKEQGQAVKDRGQTIQSKTTKMLLLTSVVFFLTWIPTAVSYTISEESFKKYHSSNAFVYMILTVIRESHLFNNAANPFIYSLVNERFRQDCRKIITTHCQFQD